MGPETDHAYVDVDLWQKWYCRARKNGLGKLGIYMKKKERKKFDLYLISHTKIKSRYAVYINDKCKTKKLWEDKMGQYLHDSGDKEIFYMAHKNH